MSNIHPTAVIEDGANIGDDVVIGPFCFVGRYASIGAGTRLISHVTVIGRTTLAECNTVWPQATLGADPQDLKFHGEHVELILGDHNDIRENVTIHPGTGNGGGVTRIGSDNLFMVGCHVGHDCLIGNHVIMANAVQLAGHVVVEDHANIAGIVGVHHYCTIGQFSYTAGMSRVVKDVCPFMIYKDEREAGVNSVGLERHRFERESIARIKDAYKRLFRPERKASDRKPANGRLGAATNATAALGASSDAGDAADAHAPGRNGVVNLADALARLEADYPGDEHIAIIARFLRNRSIGMSGRYREQQRRDDRRTGAGGLLTKPVSAEV